MNSRSILPRIHRSWATAAIVVALGIGAISLGADAGPAGEPAAFGEFVGSSPCGEAIRRPLGIPGNAACELIEWKLALYQDPETQQPSRYELSFAYGLTAPNEPGLAKDIKRAEREGAWTTSEGVKLDPDATVYALDVAISFLRVDFGLDGQPPGELPA